MREPRRRCASRLGGERAGRERVRMASGTKKKNVCGPAEPTRPAGLPRARARAALQCPCGLPARTRAAGACTARRAGRVAICILRCLATRRALARSDFVSDALLQLVRSRLLTGCSGAPRAVQDRAVQASSEDGPELRRCVCALVPRASTALRCAAAGSPSRCVAREASPLRACRQDVEGVGGRHP